MHVILATQISYCSTLSLRDIFFLRIIKLLVWFEHGLGKMLLKLVVSIFKWFVEMKSVLFNCIGCGLFLYKTRIEQNEILEFSSVLYLELNTLLRTIL